MAHSFTKNYGATRAGFEQRGAQLHLWLSGLVTSTVLAALTADVQRRVSTTPCRSIVVDYSLSVVALSKEELSQMPARLSPAMLALPTAFVVQPSVSEMFYEHAWALAQQGLLRGVFEASPLAMERAQAWATREESARCVRSRESAG
jgi:hypothetical protein